MQNLVRGFLEENKLHCNEQLRYIDLASEVGELGKEILKSTDYGKHSGTYGEDALGELGDCLFSLLALCCEMNIDAEQALNAALEKYSKRIADTGSAGSGR